MPLRRCPTLVAVALLVVLAGCGSSDTSGTAVPASTTSQDRPTTTISPTTNTTTTAAPPVTTTTASPGDTNCLASELAVSLGDSDGAAGSEMVPIVFVNTGSRECTILGFPGVSYVSATDGGQVGKAATRSGPEGVPVVLARGAQAIATVKATVIQNYSAETCIPTEVSGLNVISPNTFDPVFLSFATTGCAGETIDQLAVTAVTR